ncbi:MAG: hypothetical protein Q8940_18840 [Bacteroidota bacterium]|nr:hypothetical protein [Bacteroidota bacterium]
MSWDSLDVFNGHNMAGFKFVSSQIGYAVSKDTAKIFKTINGGNSWSLIYIDNSSDTSFREILTYFIF